MDQTPIPRQTADGRIALTVACLGGATRVAGLHESGSARLRLPRILAGPLEAVLINTAGGVAAGDRFATAMALGPGADLVVTTAAAEKIYRSEGETANIAATASLACGSRLDWLPQETILFDRARLRRRLDVDLADDASAMLYEAVVFGRAASQEVVREGFFEDRWRVRRRDRLVYADTLRLVGPIADLLARPTVADGRRALASLLYVAPDAESRLEEARAYLDGSTSECGASAWDGMLAIRFLAPAIEALRGDAARFITAFRGRPLPRVWHL